MKNVILLLFVLLCCYSCRNPKENTIQPLGIEVTATTMLNENNVRTICVTCSDGFEVCCNSPKSPVVNCVKKTGRCK